MRPKIDEEIKRDKKVTCRANTEEYNYITSKRDELDTCIRDLILLGIKTLEEQKKQ